MYNSCDSCYIYALTFFCLNQICRFLWLITHPWLISLFWSKWLHLQWLCRSILGGLVSVFYQTWDSGSWSISFFIVQSFRLFTVHKMFGYLVSIPKLILYVLCIPWIEISLAKCLWSWLNSPFTVLELERTFNWTALSGIFINLFVFLK